MIMEYAYFDKRYSEWKNFMSLNNWLAIALLQVDYRCDSKTFFSFFVILIIILLKAIMEQATPGDV